MTITKRFRSILSRREYLDAYILISPAVFIFLFFLIYPLFRTIQVSFYDYGLTNPVMKYVGLENYLNMLRDPVVWIAIRNNLIILTGSVVIQVGMGMILAAILNRGIRWGKTIFRTILFAPMVMSVVAVGVLWQLIYDPGVGFLNKILKLLQLGVPQQGWLGDPNLVVYSILAAACWQYTGFMMVLLLAGMQSVPLELYEAANLDGASEIQSFLYVTIPCIRNVILAAVLITMIGAFKVFDIVYVLTRGGPANSSQVLGTYIYYQAFTNNNAGYGSALAVVLLVVAIILGIVQLRFSRAVGGRA